MLDDEFIYNSHPDTKRSDFLLHEVNLAYNSAVQHLINAHKIWRRRRRVDDWLNHIFIWEMNGDCFQVVCSVNLYMSEAISCTTWHEHRSSYKMEIIHDGNVLWKTKEDDVSLPKWNNVPYPYVTMFSGIKAPNSHPMYKISDSQNHFLLLIIHLILRSIALHHINYQ